MAAAGERVHPGPRVSHSLYTQLMSPSCMHPRPCSQHAGEATGRSIRQARVGDVWSVAVSGGWPGCTRGRYQRRGAPSSCRKGRSAALSPGNLLRVHAADSGEQAPPPDRSMWLCTLRLIACGCAGGCRRSERAAMEGIAARQGAGCSPWEIAVCGSMGSCAGRWLLGRGQRRRRVAGAHGAARRWGCMSRAVRGEPGGWPPPWCCGAQTTPHTARMARRRDTPRYATPLPTRRRPLPSMAVQAFYTGRGVHTRVEAAPQPTQPSQRHRERVELVGSHGRR